MTIDGYWYKCQIDGTSVKYQEGEPIKRHDMQLEATCICKLSSIILGRKCQSYKISFLNIFWTVLWLLWQITRLVWLSMTWTTYYDRKCLGQTEICGSYLNTWLFIKSYKLIHFFVICY